MFAQNPDLEMTTGGGSTSNGPSTSINVNFSKNSDNPTGSTYNTYTVASGLSVTFSLQNFTAAYQGTTISGGNSVSFGHTGSTVAPQYGQFTTGAPTNVLFTSSTSTAGTGIIVNGTAATNNYGVVVKAYTSKLNPTVPRNGRVKQAELKIVFSRPVNNPILQITGLGGASGSNGFSSEFTVNTGLSDAISGITRLSGTTAFAVSGLNVTNNAVPMTASGAGVGSGSVRIDGTNITTIVLDVYMHGDGTGNLNSWGNGTNNDTNGDAFVIGFTATESDLEITKTVSPTAALVGDNVVFNLSAKNNGASNNTNVSVNDLLPTGYTYDSHIASTGAASYVPGTGVWTVGNLNDGASATLAITAKVKSTGNYTNTATISTTSGISDPLSSNNSSNAAVSILLDTDGDGVADISDLDDDNDGILDTVECSMVEVTMFSNGGFESPVLPTESYSIIPETTAGLGWKTTASDGEIELWSTNFEGTPSAEGNQFAELNANEFSTLYQEFSLNGTSGTVNWSLKHRGRDGVDVASLKFGSTLAEAQASTAAQVMTDGNTAWGSYSGVYTIPYGQRSLVIAFESTSSEGGNIVSGNFIDDVQIEINQLCIDTDNDGIPDYLDLDSDNDGCLDAIEGDENVLNSQLVNAASGLSVGTGSTAANQNLCTSSTCVDSQGVPIVVNSGGTADIGSDQGQGVGSSANAAINTCICYNDPNTATVGVDTKHGITLLERAGADNSNWPMIRKSAHTALESNTKGFVITRVAGTTGITTPQEGMMVYDTVAKCLKLYDGTAWSCFNTPACP